jgi:hypothetical protein
LSSVLLPPTFRVEREPLACQRLARAVLRGLYLPIDLPMHLLTRRRYAENGVDRSGEGRNRTGDTTVFSRVLYRLSYLAA